MAFQQTLSPEEMQLLDELNFRLTNFEDVYEEADFDACLNRLIKWVIDMFWLVSSFVVTEENDMQL